MIREECGKMRHKAICINRKCGSEGHIIGQMAAEKLGIGYYDRNLLDLALEYGGLTEFKEKFEQADERATNKAYYQLQYQGNDNVKKGYPHTETLFQLQSDLIREIVKKEDSIFIGRCANYVLQDAEDVDVLSIFITAPEEYRIQNIMKSDGLTKAKAKMRIRQVDQRRKAYYNCFAKVDWNHLSSYGIILNSEFLGKEECCDIICELYKSFLCRDK